MVAGDIGMARQLTLQQRIFIVEQWLKHDRNPTATAAAFSQEFPNDVSSSQQSMHALAKKFHETGSETDKKRSGRPENVNTDKNKENVRTLYQNVFIIIRMCLLCLFYQKVFIVFILSECVYCVYYY